MPEGVSPVKPGDTMDARIDPIGEMRVSVRAHRIGGLRLAAKIPWTAGPP
jgi:hypothetical protein